MNAVPPIVFAFSGESAVNERACVTPPPVYASRPTLAVSISVSTPSADEYPFHGVLFHFAILLAFGKGCGRTFDHLRLGHYRRFCASRRRLGGPLRGFDIASFHGAALISSRGTAREQQQSQNWKYADKLLDAIIQHGFSCRTVRLDDQSSCRFAMRRN